MQVSNEITVQFAENPALLGVLADKDAPQLTIPDYATFQRNRANAPIRPMQPIKAITYKDHPIARQVFDIVNQEYQRDYQQALRRFDIKKREVDLLNSYPANWAGYGQYLIDHFPQVIAHLGRVQAFPINEESRRMHSYITGGSGSGKSEYIKSLAWHYLTVDTSSAMIFLDPHHDVAKQIAQFKPNVDNDRLVYFCPAISYQVFPGLNPFDINDKGKLTDTEAEKIASEFFHALKEMLKEKDGDLSMYMETLLMNTLPVIVKMPETSIYNLIEFLQPKLKAQKDQPQQEYAAQRYIDFAHAHFENQELLNFLDGQFDHDSDFTRTRSSVTTRLRTIFGSTLMQNLFSGNRTIRFEDLIPQRKVIVFNLANLDATTTSIVGRFILITLKIFALNQAKLEKSERKPCHAFVDECHHFVTDSMDDILKDARKFMVFLTLAQQGAGQHPMKSTLFESILTNCATKMAGVNSGNSLTVMAKEIGIPSETIGNFRKGQFALFQREAIPNTAVVRMPTNALDNTAQMHPLQWDAILANQLERYYRPAKIRASTKQTVNNENDILAADLDMYRN
ncbi:MAG: hypothetical protein HY253_10345 [Burkholderiales bacterium]|nr:hypothetical protein [Burkholderiales bacterium]